jgi:hypothetical protein
MMKSRRGKLSHHHNVANSRNANPTVADASQRNFIDVFVLRWPAGRPAAKQTHSGPYATLGFASNRTFFASGRTLAHSLQRETREGWNYFVCSFKASSRCKYLAGIARDALCSLAIETTGCFGQMESNASANSLHTRKMRSKMLIINSTVTLLWICFPLSFAT